VTETTGKYKELRLPLDASFINLKIEGSTIEINFKNKKTIKELFRTAELITHEDQSEGE